MEHNVSDAHSAAQAEANSNQTTLDFVQGYTGQHGWFIFPAKTDTKEKKSYLSKAFNGNRWGCTNDPAVAIRCFEHFRAAGIGIATDESNLFVLDIDTAAGHKRGHDGFASLQQLEAENGPLPKTRMAQSPSGSQHYYFNKPVGVAFKNSDSELALGIDVRGSGGMVLAPPTMRNGGEYRWLNDYPVADAPDWLVKLIIERTMADNVETRAADDDEIDTEASGSRVNDVSEAELIAMAAAIKNPDVIWEQWNKIAMAVYATNSGEAGRKALHIISRKSKLYNEQDTDKKWNALRGSPPTQITAATLFYYADQGDAEWRKKFRQEHSAIQAVLIPATSIIMQPKDWLWHNHLLRGSLGLLTGLPGLGKSQAQISFVACVTAGHIWPDGSPACETGNVIMLTAEDQFQQDVVPRLVAAGADISKVHFLQIIKHDKRKYQFIITPEDLELVEHAIKKLGNVKLITIDPITAYMGGKVDSHKATQVRSQLSPLKDFAEQTQIGVSAITHPPKAGGQRAIDQFIGSQAFIAAGRIGHVCSPEMIEDENGHKVESGRILFSMAKTNVGPYMPTLAFTKEVTIVRNDPDPKKIIEAVYVKWDPTPVKITADQATAAAAGLQSAEDRKRRIEQLMNYLATRLENGPVGVKQIEKEVSGLGYSERQLRDAKGKLNIISEKSGFGDEGQWVWVLPKITR